MPTTLEVKTPRLVTALPGPNAKRVLEQDAKFMSPSYTRDYPLVAKRGHGAIVEDVDGNSFLDFAAGIAVCSTGHCHPKVVAAIQKQAAELIHMSGTDFYYESMPQLAERLSKTMPGAESKKVFFTNSGTEAIEGAIKLARYATKRDKMVAFYGCFHGRSIVALSLTASQSSQRKGFGALLSCVEHIAYLYAYRQGHGERHAARGDHRKRERDALGAGFAWHDVWRKPGLPRSRAGHDGPDRKRVQGKRPPHGRLPLRTSGRLDEELQDCRRCARTRVDDRH